MEHDMVPSVTDASFAAEIEQFSGIALVDFWATWCPPCLAMAPRIAEIAQKYAGDPRVKVVQLDIDANQETTRKFGVLSIPPFKFFFQGVSRDPRADTIVGVSPTEELVTKMEELLALLPKEEKKDAPVVKTPAPASKTK